MAPATPDRQSVTRSVYAPKPKTDLGVLFESDPICTVKRPQSAADCPSPSSVTPVNTPLPARDDGGLARIVACWPELTDGLRASLVSLAEAAIQRRPTD